MKMNKKLLRIASVFFVLLAFIGCGVATIFYVRTSLNYYSDRIEIRITDDHDNLSWIEPGSGPSLFLGYVVTDNPGLDYSTKTKIRDEFRKQYQKTPSGIHIEGALTSGPVLLLTDPSIGLYAFSASEIGSPTYHATASNRLSPNGDFTITEEPSENGSQLKLTFPSGEYQVHTPVLRRFNGALFSTTYTNESDYVYSNTSSATAYCHIFGAINAGKGNFNNIYWSDLEYLSYIEIKKPSD